MPIQIEGKPEPIQIEGKPDVDHHKEGEWLVDEPEQQEDDQGNKLFAVGHPSGKKHPMMQVSVYTIDDYGHLTICTLVDDSTTWMASARLISAAPNMLEALEAALPCLEYHESGISSTPSHELPTHEDFQAASALIKASIAKAKGDHNEQDSQ